MTDNIVIRLFEDSLRPVEWMLTDDTGARHGEPQSGRLSGAKLAAAGHRVIVMLPAVDTLILTADVPAKGSRLLQALPFALEEQLADDIDQLHFAAGKRRSSGRTPAVVIKRERFDDYMSRLVAAEIQADAVYSEAQGLARIPGTISMLIEDSNLTINDGADIEVSLRQMSPGDALVAIGALDDSPPDATDADSEDTTASLPGHLLVYLSAEDNERFENDWLALRNELDSVETRLLPDGALPRLAANLSTGKATNLLQGDYAVETNLSAKWQPWRLVAILLLAVTALGVVDRTTNYYALKREHQRVNSELAEQWKKTLPWISPMPENPARRLDAELRRMGKQSSGGGGDSPFLGALEALATATQGKTKTSIDGISFRAGVTDVQLVVPSESELDQIRMAVQKSGEMEATIQRADRDQEAGNVKSRLQIKGQGS